MKYAILIQLCSEQLAVLCSAQEYMKSIYFVDPDYISLNAICRAHFEMAILTIHRYLIEKGRTCFPNYYGQHITVVRAINSYSKLERFSTEKRNEQK